MNQTNMSLLSESSESSDVKQYYQANRKGMKQFLPNNYVKVLEIGCATGLFSESIRNQNCEIWGVELDEKAAELAKTKMDYVLTGTYEAVVVQIPNNYFDLVICNDVIEHMPDHDSFLESIKSKMIFNGYLIGSIPNIRCITSLFKILLLKDWPYSDEGILDRTHLRFFTAKSFTRSLKEHNYSIEEFTGLNSIIKRGVVRSSQKQRFLNNNWLYQLISLAVVILTFGYYWDTQYPQFGFRVKLKN